MTSQAVEEMWFRTGSYRQLRGRMNQWFSVVSLLLKWFFPCKKSGHGIYTVLTPDLVEGSANSASLLLLSQFPFWMVWLEQFTQQCTPYWLVYSLILSNTTACSVVINAAFNNFSVILQDLRWPCISLQDIFYLKISLHMLARTSY